MTKIIKSLIELIGDTPLLDLSHILPPNAANLYAKMEMFNPGGSIKDRPALAMIEAAEKDGRLKPGMTIVEATAGNTGIGLALVGNAKGYKTAFFVPDRMSSEKIAGMKLLGAKVILVDKDLGIKGCMEQAEAYMAEHGNCFMAQQFENPANPDQAQRILGAEIRGQLGFYPDGIAIGAGSGGTFTGLARWLKQHNPNGIAWLVEPVGSIYKGGEKGCYQIEGIGNSFIPKNLDLDLADDIISVPDDKSFQRCRQVAEAYGFLVGGSCGANLEASLQLCEKLGPGKTVVTVFSDSLERYVSKPWVQNIIKEME